MLYACVLPGSWAGPAQFPWEAHVSSTQSSSWKGSHPPRLSPRYRSPSSLSVLPNQELTISPTVLLGSVLTKPPGDTLLTPLPLLAYSFSGPPLAI